MKAKKNHREDMLHFDNYLAEIDGKLTFMGVMQQCLDIINKDWNAVETRKLYYSYYERVLFPLIPERPLESITEKDFFAVIEKVIQQGIESRAPYSQEMIQRFKRLIRVVTVAAKEAGICEDVLWGENFRKDESPKKVAQKRAKPKSLAPTEEHKVCDLVLIDPKEAGELVGIAIMFALGTRNQDACGLNWSSFDYLAEDDVGFLTIISSTKIGTNQVQRGGKTFNAPRILPVTGLLLHLLAARRKWIEELIRSDGETDQETISKKLADLPIVCKGSNYRIRCGSNDLTRCAKGLLKNIGLEEAVMEEISEMLEQRFANKYDERDATAYLFRRNFATHMEILGFDEDTIHYLMGHEFADEEVTKARYTNRDTLAQIGKRMCRRAIINTELEAWDDNHVLLASESKSGTAHGTTRFTIDTNGTPTKIVCFIKPRGASNLKISLDYEKAPEEGQIIISPEQFQTTSELSEKMTYAKVYQKDKSSEEEDR